jgi:hypothetical protein
MIPSAGQKNDLARYSEMSDNIILQSPKSKKTVTVTSEKAVNLKSVAVSFLLA